MFDIVEVDTKRRYPIRDRLTIGRGRDNDVHLQERMVSLYHAEIARSDDGSYLLRDMDSRYGTFLKDQKVTEAGLQLGDELQIGSTRLRVEAAAITSDRGCSDELKKLRALVELSRSIGVDHDLDRLLGRVLDACFQLLRADRGMIVTYLPGSKTPCAIVARTRDGERLEAALSTSVLSQVLATREPYLRTQIDEDLALQGSESLSLSGVRSLVAVPLLYETNEAEWLGVINLDSRAMDNLFEQADLEFLTAIAGQAALAIKNAMLVRQMQEARGAELQRLQRVVSDLPVGVVVLDEARRCVLANDWVLRRQHLLGAIPSEGSVEQLAGIPVERLLGGERRHQVTLRNPETTLVVEAHTSDRDAVVVVTDISEERAQHAKVAHQDRLALIGQLAGGIAHDFNNLLFVILAHADFLAEAVTTPESEEDARLLIDAARSAGDLVHQLLAFSRREVVKPRVVDVSRLIAKRAPMLESAMGGSITLAIRPSPIPAHVLVDPSQLEQVVMNLCVNARDAMAGRGSLSVVVDTTPTHATISITDTGTGMSPDIVARIFEPYFTTKSRGKGTGLGLATVHGIVHEVGGTIDVRSELGRGTTFVVALPLTDFAPEEPVSALTTSSRGGRILIVDDDDHIRQLTSRMLQRSGYEVVAVASGDAALAEVTATPFDIVLTDSVMPGMSGRDLIRALEAVAPTTKVVLMSAYPTSAVATIPFLAKPFDRNALLTTLGDAARTATRSTT